MTSQWESVAVQWESVAAQWESVARGAVGVYYCWKSDVCVWHNTQIELRIKIHSEINMLMKVLKMQTNKDIFSAIVMFIVGV